MGSPISSSLTFTSDKSINLPVIFKKDSPLRNNSNCPLTPSSISQVSGKCKLISAERLSACGL